MAGVAGVAQNLSWEKASHQPSSYVACSIQAPRPQDLKRKLPARRNDPEAWRGLQAAGMAQDLSWEKAAREYEQIFGWALMDAPVRPW